MALSVRSFSQGSGSADTAITKPTGTASGDFLVCTHYQGPFWAASNMTAPTGWSQSGVDGGDSGHAFVKVWTLVAGGSEPTTYTFGILGAGVAIIHCITGQDTTTPVNVVPSFNTAVAATSQVANSVTPTVDNCLLLCAWGEYDSATATYTAPASMTKQGDGQYGTTQKQASATQILSGGSGTATGTRTAVTTHSTNPYISLSMLIAPLVVAASGAAPQSLVRGFARQRSYFY